MDQVQAVRQWLWVRIQPIWAWIVRWFEHPTRRNITIGLTLGLLGSVIIRGVMPDPHVSIAAEPIFEQGNQWLVNSLVSMVLIDIILIAVALYVRTRIKEIPSGFANAMEALIEGLYNLTESVAGKNARRWFAWVATLFLFILVSNYTGLIPGLGGSFGVFHDYAAHSSADVALVSADASMAATELAATQVAEEGKRKFIPLFRPPSADLNFTFAIAIMTMILVQWYGFKALGGHYFHKFFNFNTGKGAMRGIFAFSGILELVSEFAKVISFSFRLFGNIFAGEVLLGVMAFLVAFMIPIPFYFLELFIGLIQALVFMMLAVVFFSTSVISHGGEEHH